MVGVAPRRFRRGPGELDAYTPLRIDPSNPGSVGGRSFDCYGRLRPGVGVAAARAEMAAIGAALARQYPYDEGMGVFVAGLHDYLVRDGRPALRFLMAAVAAVLLIACANVAGLQLGHGA